MTQGPILDPLRQIATDDLKIIGARIREGSELQRGQIATIEVGISLSRAVESFAARLRIYQTDGRCVFISPLKNNGAFEGGVYRVDFYIIAGLPVGKYILSFEFQDNSLDEVDEFDVKKILALNSLYVEFVLKNNADIDENIYAGGFNYISVPVEVVINKLIQGALGFQDLSASEAASSFPCSWFGKESIQAESIIKKIHNKIVGVEPTDDGLGRLLETFKNNESGIDAVLDELIKDDRSWDESIKNNAGKLIYSFYVGLLNRKPEFNTIDLKREVKLIPFLRNIVNSSEFLGLSASRTAFQEFEVAARKSQVDGCLEFDGDCIFVHTPLDGIFAYCALACCRQVRHEYPEKKIYLISDVALQAELLGEDLSVLYIDGVIRTKDVFDNWGEIDLNPGLIISHSEGSIDNAARLLELYPQALLGVWADGFRNVANANRWMPHAKVRVVYFFSFRGVLTSKELLLERVLPSCFLWDSQRVILNKRWGAFELDAKNFSVFYPRYWWRAPYLLSHEFIVSSWVDMVLENSSEDELIVVKTSPLYNDGTDVVSNFIEKLVECGRNVVYADEFCESFGLDKKMANLSAEDLFCLGVFGKAKKHYVLDGSLATIIASHPGVIKPSQLVLGSKFNAFDQNIPNMLKSNLSIQMRGVMALSNCSLLNNSSVGAGVFPAVVEID